MKRNLTLLSGLLLASLPAAAGELDFSLSDDSFRAAYDLSFAGNILVSPAWMHTDVHDVRSDVLYCGLFARGKSANVTGNFGGKVFYLDTEKADMHGAAFGGNVDIQILPTQAKELSLGVEAFYAPDILTGGDFDNYLELGTRLSFRIVSNATVFIGYRLIEIELENSSTEQDIDKGGFAGFRIRI
jgi:hypothetical protein